MAYINHIYTIDEIKDILDSIFADQPVYKAILFGSYAKNTATAESDIDIIIDTNGMLRGFALLALINKIEERLNKRVDCFEQYEIIADSKIDNEIKNTGVVVYER